MRETLPLWSDRILAVGPPAATLAGLLICSPRKMVWTCCDVSRTARKPTTSTITCGRRSLTFRSRCARPTWRCDCGPFARSVVRGGAGSRRIRRYFSGRSCRRSRGWPILRSLCEAREAGSFRLGAHAESSRRAGRRSVSSGRFVRRRDHIQFLRLGARGGISFFSARSGGTHCVTTGGVEAGEGSTGGPNRWGVRKWREEWDVPRYVCLTFGDNRLILDLECPSR